MNKFITKIRGFIFYNLGFLEARFHWKTRKYLSKHYNKGKNVTNTKNKTLIYMLDGRAYSGGISDIVKGIISMFKFSKEIGYDFRINFCFPFDLIEYYEPNKYDWSISENEISYNSEYSSPLWLYSAYLVNGKSREFEIKHQRKVLHRFLKKNERKQQYHIYTNSEWASDLEYSQLFNELFKPSKMLQEVLLQHKNNLRSEYISMTFRFQQLLGDFTEQNSGIDRTSQVFDLLKKTKESGQLFIPDHGEFQLRALLGDFKNKKISVPLSEEEASILMAKCIKKINEIHSTLYADKKILITADSEKFLSKVSSLDFVYNISKDNVNIKEVGNEKFNIFLKSFVDILMLSEAKKLFLLCTDKMYRSAFARNASYINNREYEEIFF